MGEEYCDPNEPLCRINYCYKHNSCDARKRYWNEHNKTVVEIFKGLGNHVIRQQMKNSQKGFKELVKIRESEESNI
jgi:hypothetical protein